MITEEQRIERRNGIGGSDVASIIPDGSSPTGYLSPWSTAVTVWLEKTGRSGPKPESEAMWWGTEEEALVARRFTELTGLKTVNHRATVKDGILFANLDRLIQDGDRLPAYKGEIRASRIFEAKTSGRGWEDAPVIEELEGSPVYDGWAGIPKYYITQCNHYLGRVPSAECIYLAAKMSIPCRGFSRTDFRIYRLNRDDAIIKAQDEFVRWWWNEHIVGGRMPEATCEDEAKKLWFNSNPSTSVVMDEELAAAFAKLRTARLARESAEADEDSAKTEIMNAMKENETLVGEDGKTVFATWKQGKGSSNTVTDWEAVARELSLHVEGGVTMLDTLAKEHTSVETKPGRRTFLPKFNEKTLSEIDAHLAAKAEGTGEATPPEKSVA